MHGLSRAGSQDDWEFAKVRETDEIDAADLEQNYFDRMGG